MAFQSSNPDPPGNLGRFVRVTDATGGPVADAVQVFPSPPQGTSYRDLTLCTNDVTGEHGAMTWDAAVGCRIVSLDGGARPRGAPLAVSATICSNLANHSNGWSFLEGASGARDPQFVRVGRSSRSA